MPEQADVQPEDREDLGAEDAVQTTDEARQPQAEPEAVEGEEPETENPDEAGEPQEGTEDPDAASPPRRETRGSRRFQELSNRAARAEAELAAERRVREELHRQQQASLMGQQRAQQDIQERERLALMSADEKVEYYRQKDRQELEQRLGQIQFQQQDVADRAAFDRLCDRSPAIAEVADEVERILADERRAGRPGASREVIAKFVIGDRALKGARKAGAVQRQRAQANIQRNAAVPVAPRGDIPAGRERRGSEAAAREKRLSNIEI